LTNGHHASITKKQISALAIYCLGSATAISQIHCRSAAPGG